MARGKGTRPCLPPLGCSPIAITWYAGSRDSAQTGVGHFISPTAVNGPIRPATAGGGVFKNLVRVAHGMQVLGPANVVGSTL